MDQQPDQRRTALRHSIDTGNRLSPWAATHRELRAMADSLRMEYAGAAAPGSVTAAVFRAYRSVLRDGVLPGQRLQTCEAMARRRLTDMLAMDGRHTRAALARR
jgi:hypothetical protein